MKPKLRFKGYNDEWQKVKLGEIADIYGGGTPSTSCEENWGGDILWFTPAEIGQNKYLTKSSRTITQKGFDESSTVMLPPGTILLSSRATIGEASIAVLPCTTNQGFQSLIPKETTSEFVYALINTLKQTLIKESNGSTFLEISGNKVRNLNINLPSSSEQTAIGEYFKQLDSAINKSESEITKLKQIKKASLQSMFPQPGERKPKLRFKGFNDDWKEVKIGEVFEEGNERSGNEQLLSVSISRGVYPTEEFVKTRTVTDFSSYKRVYPSDIVYNSMRMWQGASGVSKEHGIVSPAYTILHPKAELDSNFYGYLFKLPHVIKIFEANSQGLTKDTWNLKYPAISLLSFKIPSLAEQQAIAEYFSNLDSQISLLSKKLEKLKQVKKACLSQMFV